ncbi:MULTISPECIES: hypothetical protein [Bradyrhizobium]|jgi:hypothetical protein|uniref:hypothetical protein n=1 Tax=Bradyrhizobium TaxID=374 RepID=UPI000397DACA|nr:MULTISPECIES: hypothetical protein [Bradyrhizobium]ERF84971.1 MAG: hypothetical protein C207_01791 [Bradyrhizobium sp. DFCI-1]
MKQHKIQHLHQPIEEALLATNQSLRNEVVALMLDIAELREIHERPVASRSFGVSRQQTAPRAALHRGSSLTFVCEFLTARLPPLSRRRGEGGGSSVLADNSI